MRENKNQKNSEYGQFSRSACFNFKSMLLGLWAMFDKYFVMGHLKITFAQDSRVLTPPSSLVRPCLFLSIPPSPKVRFFWLELTLFPSICLNSTYLLRSHIGVSIKWTPLVHDKRRFMEMSALQRVHLKVRVIKSKHEIY